MNQLSQDEKYMQRCLQLAELAEGNTYPNPMVGSVIVHDGKIIGEGYHRKAGEAHAEVNAVKAVQNKNLLKSSILYVNLEPCAHYGKTPPCSKLIIDYNIPKVVIGCIDSYSEVAGKGVNMMEEAGIEVISGVLEQESLELNRRFFTFYNRNRPYIILKWAESQDGFLDIERDENNYGKPTWITNDWARRSVHKQRTTEQAILVGTKTVLKDNPSLTVRSWDGNQPLRCVIDRQLRIPETHHIFAGQAPTVVYNVLQDKRWGVHEYTKLIDDNTIPSQLLADLWKRNIQSVIIEGGCATIQQFIDNGLWDEAHQYKGDVLFGRGVAAPTISGRILRNESFGSSKLRVYRNN